MRCARELERAQADGIRAVAVVLMHAYRYSDHEQRIAALARELGFAQVSASHEVSPLIKLVGRGDTTVVDCYLSPILRRYVAQVAGDWTRSLACRKRNPPDVHDVVGRAHGGRVVSRQRRDPVGPAAASSAWPRPGGRRASKILSASTWAAPRPTCRISPANTSARSRPKSPACACARR